MSNMAVRVSGVRCSAALRGADASHDIGGEIKVCPRAVALAARGYASRSVECPRLMRWRWRIGRTGSPGHFACLQRLGQSSPPETPSLVQPVRPVRHRLNLLSSLRFLANRSRGSSVRPGYAKGPFGSPLTRAGSPRRTTTRSGEPPGVRNPLRTGSPPKAAPPSCLAARGAGFSKCSHPGQRSCRHKNRYREPPSYVCG